ncbi:hypothetical protein ACFZBU_33465 [Embleya sp. NPDC008237]|uniref:phage terminase small subunit n=1 Tax=Embleya sp. NPDC008237 TaxID=3363978 RepID=UPI0036EDC9CB
MLRGPELPDDALPDLEPWHPRTVGLWQTWRRSAQARDFLPTDWDFLIDAALMHHTMWTRGRWVFMSELRIRAAEFGATVEDRVRLRMTIEVPADDESAKAAPPNAASVTDIRSRWARLTS